MSVANFGASSFGSPYVNNDIALLQSKVAADPFLKKFTALGPTQRDEYVSTIESTVPNPRKEDEITIPVLKAGAPGTAEWLAQQPKFNRMLVTKTLCPIDTFSLVDLPSITNAPICSWVESGWLVIYDASHRSTFLQRNNQTLPGLTVLRDLSTCKSLEFEDDQNNATTSLFAIDMEGNKSCMMVIKTQTFPWKIAFPSVDPSQEFTYGRGVYFAISPWS